MSAVTSSCPNCGFHLEADCDFCPGCGAPKIRPEPARQPTHSWMGEAPHRDTPGRSNPVTVPQYAMQVPSVPYAVSPIQIEVQDAGANTARTMGIIVISLMVVGLIPCLGWVNYITLTLAFVTVIISIIGASNAKSTSARSAATLGLVFALIAGFVGFIRLIIGGGCL